MQLEDAITDSFPSEPWRVGIVTGTAGARVVVTVEGASLTLPRLESYTPTIGHTVQIACPKGRWFVLGKIAS